MAFYTTNLPTEADKVIYAVAFLRGSTLAWFKPTQRNYLTYTDSAKRDTETRKTFNSYKRFEKKIKGAFSDPDEERTAE